MRTLQSFILCLLLLACKNNANNRPEKPDNLISQDKMVEVLYDMALVSSAKGVGKRALENRGFDPENFVYSKHNIDSIQFKKSNAYYAYDIETYESMYNKVKAKLEMDKTGFQAIIDEEKKKRDSIAKRNREQDSLARLKKNRTGSDSTKLSTPDRLNKVGKSQ